MVACMCGLHACAAQCIYAVHIRNMPLMGGTASFMGLSSAAHLCPFCRSLAVRYTLAFCLASAMQQAQPMPLLPPVTSTVLPDIYTALFRLHGEAGQNVRGHFPDDNTDPAPRQACSLYSLHCLERCILSRVMSRDIAAEIT